MEKETFKQYASIKNQIKELTAEAKELEPELTAEITKAGIDVVKTEFGTFSITKRKTWTYSGDVTELEDKVKIQKKEEEEKGVATFEEKTGLMFR